MAETSQTCGHHDYFTDRPIPSPAISPGKEHLGAKRSLTPRGQIFPNLQDAHRNITNRLASNNPFRQQQHEQSQHPPQHHSEDDIASSSPGLTKSSSLGCPSSSSHFTESGVVQATCRQHQRSHGDDEDDEYSPSLQRMASGRSLTGLRRVQILSSTAGQSDDARAHEAPQKVDTASSVAEYRSGSTVEKIYEQYAIPNDRGSSPVSHATSAEAYVLSASGESRNLDRGGAISRFGFRDDEDNSIAGLEKPIPGSLADKRQQPHQNPIKRRDFPFPLPRLRTKGSSSQPPNVALPLCPKNPSDRVVSEASEKAVSPLQSSNVIDSQDLLETRQTVRDSPPQCQALQRQSQPLLGYQHAEVTDDNDEWISDTQSSLVETRTEDLFKYDNRRYRECLRPIQERDASTALHGLVDPRLPAGYDGADDRPADPDCDVSALSDESRWEDVAGSFFHPAAVKSLTGEKVNTRDVRVVIKGQPQRADHDLEALDQVGDLGSKLAFPQDKILREETNAGDWVTVATSNFDRGSQTPEGLFGGGIQATGSSIANISDEDDRDYRRDPLGTRDMVLQHPAANEHSNSYFMRTLKDTKRQVLLPSNNKYSFPLNSLRGLSDATDQFQFVSTREQSQKYNFRDSLSEAKSRRECWFYMMAVLSILPFFALLILMGVFDPALASLTKGEVYELTKRQKRVIQTMFIAECIVYAGCMASLIVYFVVKSQGL
ncbi:hypothetical protein Micbo1qcDRAFT_204746 [Microdochium bolleyi]|uniref:Uncharacterized protein n=1 Tax=Microdochium bolleyi TaxID=196109 RepID=A0A136J346_9PEZI|nr:hypothetical protein Micbo1qcDRAFT_204746 [Microdochium bolleyi]